MITAIMLANRNLCWAVGLIVAIVVVVVIVGVMVIGIYNKLVTMRNRYKNAYAQIDVQLKRRYDLIPNLVETAKGYMASTSADAGSRHRRAQHRLRRVESRRRQSRRCHRDEKSGLGGNRPRRHVEPLDDGERSSIPT